MNKLIKNNVASQAPWRDRQVLPGGKGKKLDEDKMRQNILGTSHWVHTGYIILGAIIYAVTACPAQRAGCVLC